MTNDSTTTEHTENLIDSKAVGVEVSWSFGDGDATAVSIDRNAVRRVFEANGVTAKDALDLVPDLDADAALKRALRYAPKKKHLAIKEFARPSGSNKVRAVGIYVRDPNPGEAGDGWECEARVRWDAGRLACLPPEGRTAITNPEARKVGESMARMANSVMSDVMNVDLSDALCTLGHRRGWITRRRNSGGVYFMPTNTSHGRAVAESFVNILMGLAALTDHLPRHRQFIPQAHDLFPSPMTMRSWAGSAEDNFAADIEKLQKELDRMAADGKMRDTTKAERAAQADAIIAKAENYRVFLGDAVDRIGAKLDKIKAEFKAAIGENLVAAEAALDGAVEVPKAKPAPKPKAPKGGRKAVTLSDDELFNL